MNKNRADQDTKQQDKKEQGKLIVNYGIVVNGVLITTCK